jgi:hypothetical protein
MNRSGHSRRSFLGALSFATPIALATPSLFSQENTSSEQKAQAKNIAAKELATDVVVIGGGTGGCAAALAAARNGFRVIMTEETDWIGGQLTSQAVPPDENPWIETFGGTRSYLEFRQRVRDYYSRNYPLTAEARSRPYFNPGNGSVSRLCHEPRVALAVLEEMLAPWVGSQRVRILLRHAVKSASVNGDRIEAVSVKSLETGNETVLRAPLFIDATEQGDLLPLTKTEYVTGAESKKDTGEPHAAEEANPRNLQAFTVCFAMDYLAGQDHTIEKPAEYDFWRDYVPRMNPPWPGKLLSFFYSNPATLEPRNYGFDAEKAGGFFLYRRLIDRTNFKPGTYAGDITLVNWPMNDYLLGNLLDVPEAEAAHHLRRAKQLSLSLMYWLQTEAPRPDGGTGWKGLRLRPDIVGSEDGMAKYPYIRESRRIVPEFRVLEQHVATDARAKALGLKPGEATAEVFKDSVGIGSYRIDLHPSTTGDNYIDVSSLPYQIPLGALLPKRVENLLPASKNLGVTHITNGCFRLHPVEWNIGESVGALAAFCLSRKLVPRQVRAKAELLRDFQGLLTQDGVPMSWPKVTPR